MQWETPEHSSPLSPLEYHHFVPVQATAASDRLGWTGLVAAQFNDLTDAEFDRPPLTHHALVLFNQPPDEFDLRYEDVERHRPPPIGAVSVLPAGLPSRWRWHGSKSSLHVYLEPKFVTHVAAESFDLDPAAWELPPLDGLDLPHLRTTLRAVEAELEAGGVGGSLAAESLANILAIHLLRHVSAPCRAARGRDGVLPRSRLQAVIEYIEEHLDASPTLDEMAHVARLSAFHFARQFKAATGLPPHQYVIARRIDRAKRLLHGDDRLPLAEVATSVGFADQSQFSRHFKRLVGVTPGLFRAR